jgi:beta-lactamase superfamily II metal-dependent hydrolase
MSSRRTAVFVIGLLCVASFVYAQANGKLQIHYMDVGQGDGAVLISPKGQVVLFDDGAYKNCDKPVAYLQQLGVTAIDYHIASHYHADHIGCASEVFAAYPLKLDAFDRGESYPGGVYQAYLKAVGPRGKTATVGTVVTLDQGPSNPVTITIVALNGNGVSTTNENDLSVVSVVRFGNFVAEFGGDLSGFQTSSYQDIETSVAPKVGRIDIYKVHHHCSAYSSNDTWLQTTHPRIGIISTGNGNTYHHPTDECLERLHKAGVKTYWTEEGNGAAPEPGFDIVAGSVTVEVAPGASEYTVTQFNGGKQTFPTWATSAMTTPTPTPTSVTPTPTPQVGSYAWSSKSKVYHFSTCRFVQSISPQNLEQGPTPPPGKTLHDGCPK